MQKRFTAKKNGMWSLKSCHFTPEIIKVPNILSILFMALVGLGCFTNHLSAQATGNMFTVDQCYDQMTWQHIGTDNTGRSIRSSNQINGIMQWSVFTNRWEVTFGGSTFVYWYNEFASKPNPPDFNTGTWVFNDCTASQIYGPGTQSTLTNCDDMTPPTLNCPADQTRTLDDMCFYTLDNFTVDATNVTDDCTINPVVTQIPTPGVIVAAAAPILVTLTATDDTGKTGTCTFNVTVEDNQTPTLICPMLDVETILVKLSDNATATDYGWAIKDANMSTVASGMTSGFTPTLVLPVLDCGADYTIEITTFTSFPLAQLQVTTNAGLIINEYAVGNGESFSFNIPACASGSFGGSVAAGECSAAVNGLKPIALDNCSSLSVNYTLSGATNGSGYADASGAMFNVGTTTLTYTATDYSGGSNSCSIDVIVTGANTPPTAVCTNPTVNLPSNGSISVDASLFDGGSSVVCGQLSLSASQTTFDCSDAGNTVAVTLTVSAQGSNQTANCTANVTVADPNSYCCAPANAVCNNTSVQIGPGGTGSIMPSDVGGGSTTACGLMSESVSPMDFDCPDVGAPVGVTYTIVDVNGATSSCNATVTVEDNIPPVPVCKTTTIEIQPGGTYLLKESDVYDDNASTDNCSIDMINFAATTYDCNDKGQTFTVAVTVTDAGWNTASCNATITVTVGGNLPGGWTASSIGNTGSLGNSTSFDPCSTTNTNGAFVITGGGNNATSSTTDNIAFAGQSICGDGTITAKVESVDQNGYGGLMIRETTNAAAKQVAIFSNLSNLLRHEVRYLANGPKQVSTFFKPSPIWLRLERQGNWIFAYYSTNGVAFQYVHAVMVSMQSCIEFGMASFTYMPGQQTNATFSNVTVTGTPATNATVPGITEEAETKFQQGVHLYPNPANNIVNITFDDGLANDAIVTLRNQLGQVVEQRELRVGDFVSEWDVSNLTNGLYLFEIHQDNGAMQVLRLVKI